MQAILFMGRNRRYTAFEQYADLKGNYVNSFGSLNRNGFTWICDLQPSAISETYRIKITYAQNQHPKIYVISPKPLPLAKGAKVLPHTYDSKKQQICLYNPHFNEWNSKMRISQSIVHWALEWLFYYEEWLSTGIWKGGGHGNWDVEFKENT